MQTIKIGRREACRYLLASAAGGALALAGCGGRKPMGGGYTRDGRIILDYWNGFTGPDGKTMQAMVSRFQAENPDVLVQMQLIPWGTYYDKLTLSMAYGGAPDIFILQVARLPEFAHFGVIRPLEDQYAQSLPRLTARDFVPITWNRSFYQGRQYGLPLDIHLLGLYYNTKLFEDAGIVDAQGKARPPSTWTEFLDAARRLTKDTGGKGRTDQWGFVFVDQMLDWGTLAGQYGGGVLTPDGRRAAMSSPVCLAASRQMRDLIYTYRVAPRPEGVDAWLAFRQGKVAMAMAGVYMLHSLTEQQGLQFAGAPVPQFGPRRATYAGSNILCQPHGLSADHARAAFRLMRFLSDHSLTWASAGMLPARAGLMRTPEFQAMTVQAQFARQIPYLSYDPLSPHLNSLGQFSGPAVEAVLLNLQTPEQAMREADRRMDELLRRTEAE